MKHVIRFIVGMVVLYILLAIFMLDPGQALLLIAISVICTAGISLIIWIPLAYVVGWGVLALITWITGWSIEPGSSPPAKEEPAQAEPGNIAALSQQLDQQLKKEPALTNDQRAVAAYIRKALDKGLSREKIMAKLQDNGWGADSIKWGFDFVAGESVS
jgi:cell division protein FtsW (lipid II flippase)